MFSGAAVPAPPRPVLALARSWLGARLRGGVRTFSFPLTMSSAISDDNLALKRLNLNFRRNNLNPQSTVLWWKYNASHKQELRMLF